MITRFLRTMFLLLVILGLNLVGADALSAQTQRSPGGTGPDDAMLPPGGWTEIQPGQFHWYKFHFQVDREKAMKPIEIRLYSDPLEAAILTVRNEHQAELWRQSGENQHFGCCTLTNVDRDNNGTPDYASWSSNLNENGDYYIVVHRDAGRSGPVRYFFTMTGDGFSFPTSDKPATVAQPAQQAVAPAPAQPRVTPSLAGTGPDYAMTPTGQWQTLQSGAYHWYAFRFEYDSIRASEPVEIRMYTEPWNGATLTVRNQAQAEQWRRTGEQQHFGCCTSVDVDRNNDGRPDYAVWSGALRETATYYIVIEHARDIATPVQYLFTITGKGVSFPSVGAPYAVLSEAIVAPASPAPVVAPVASISNSGPDNAMRPTGAWMELQPGEYHWYKFQFKYDEQPMKAIEVRLYSEPQDGVLVDIRNVDQVQAWRGEGKNEHFGRTTPSGIDKDSNGRSDYGLWASNLRATGTYYLVVRHEAGASAPVRYQLTISGDGVSY